MLQNWEHGDYVSNSPSKLTNQRTTYCSPEIGTIDALHSRSQGDNQEKKKTHKNPTICTTEIHGSSHAEMFAGAEPSSIRAFQLPHTQLTGLRC